MGYAAGLPEPAVAKLAARFEQDAYFWWDGARFWLVATDGGERVRLPG